MVLDGVRGGGGCGGGGAHRRGGPKPRAWAGPARVCVNAAAAAVGAEKGRSFHWLAGELGSSPQLWLRRSLKNAMLMHGEWWLMLLAGAATDPVFFLWQVEGTGICGGVSLTVARLRR